MDLSTVHLITPGTYPKDVEAFLRNEPMSRRVDALNAVYADSPHLFGDDPHLARLVVLGALGLLASGRAAHVPEPYDRILGQFAIEVFDRAVPRTPDRDPAEALR